MSATTLTTLSVAATFAAALALVLRHRHQKQQPEVRRVLRLGTRSSDLAMVQTHWVAARLRAQFPDVKVVILKGVDAFGDLQLTQSLKELAAKTPGLFTKELEAGLQLNAYDAVVHSLKDMPTQLPDGLELAGITEREDPRDAVVLHPKYKGRTGGLACLPKGAVVGTSSVRREAFIRRDFPHLDIQLIRGNVNTRLAKLDRGEYDAIVLAAAGLKRLGPQFAARISHVLEPEEMMYGVSQGSLGLQCRANDGEVCAMLASISDPHAYARCTAERSLLRTLQGGCQVPLGVHTIVREGDVLELQCTMLGDRGTVSLRADITGQCADAHELGVSLAQRLLESGGREIMGHDGIELGEGQVRPMTYGSAEAPNISARPNKK